MNSFVKKSLSLFAVMLMLCSCNSHVDPMPENSEQPINTTNVEKNEAPEVSLAQALDSLVLFERKNIEKYFGAFDAIVDVGSETDSEYQTNLSKCILSYLTYEIIPSASDDSTIVQVAITNKDMEKVTSAYTAVALAYALNGEHSDDMDAMLHQLMLEQINSCEEYVSQTVCVKMKSSDDNMYWIVDISDDFKKAVYGTTELHNSSVGGKMDENDIIKVDAGAFYSIGLTGDGHVFLAGGSESTPLNEAIEWEGVTDISAGSYHAVGLLSGGYAVAVGKNDSGQCDVNLWSDIKKVVAGNNFTLGIKNDGTVIKAGIINKFGIEEEDASYNLNTWADISNIACGTWHVVGLKNDGTVIAAGDNEYGQCNVEDWRNITQITAGDGFTVGLTKEGTVLIAGKIGSGTSTSHKQSGYDDMISALADISFIDAGSKYLLAIVDGGDVTVVGQVASSHANAIANWQDVISVAAGHEHTVGLLSNGTVVSCGDNRLGQCEVSGWAEME